MCHDQLMALNEQNVIFFVVELIGGYSPMEGNILATNKYNEYGPVCTKYFWSQRTVRIVNTVVLLVSCTTTNFIIGDAFHVKAVSGL